MVQKWKPTIIAGKDSEPPATDAPGKPKRRGRRPGHLGPYNTKERPVEQRDDIKGKRAKAYADMECHLCDLVRMGEIASMMFDKDEGLFIFATTHLEEMLHQFQARYYAEDFPRIWQGGTDNEGTG